MNIAIDPHMASLAARMRSLKACPACGEGGGKVIFADTDITHLETLPDDLRHADYTLCPACGLIYAAWRQVGAAAEAYYGLFPELEHRRYAVYPPPEDYRAGKARVAEWLAGFMASHDLLDNAGSLLHIRSDCGSLGPVLARRAAHVAVTGGDYFETNLRHSRDSGAMEDVYRLKPAGIERLGKRRFDIVVVNHMFTHAIDLGGDVAACRDMLAPNGAMVIYNEIDGLEYFRPGSRYWRLKPINNYHKQIFGPASFRRFLAAAGLRLDHVERRKNTLVAIARRDDRIAMERAGADEIAGLARLVEKWNRDRASWRRAALDFTPARKVYKALARKPEAV